MVSTRFSSMWVLDYKIYTCLNETDQNYTWRFGIFWEINVFELHWRPYRKIVVGAGPWRLQTARNPGIDLNLKRNIAVLFSDEMTNLQLMYFLARPDTYCTKMFVIIYLAFVLYLFMRYFSFGETEFARPPPSNTSGLRRSAVRFVNKSSKKKSFTCESHVPLHKWRTSHTPFRQLYGKSAYSQVKVKMKILRSPTGLHLFLILICRMATWDHLWSSEYFQWVFTYEITCKWHVPSEITCEIQNISNEFWLMKI